LLVKQLIGFAVREHTPFPRRSILAASWERMLVVELVVMALCQRGLSLNALSE